MKISLKLVFLDTYIYLIKKVPIKKILYLKNYVLSDKQPLFFDKKVKFRSRICRYLNKAQQKVIK